MATDSELLSIRPRLRNDAVFLRVETGVYLRHSESACVLKGRLAYQWVSVLGPRMTGERSLGELCAGLDEAQRRTVLRLTGALLERGFVRNVPDAGDAEPPGAALARFRPQINLIEHFTGLSGESPAARFGRFRAARALVAGSAPVLTAAARGLLCNGMAELSYVAPPGGPGVTEELEREAVALRADGVPVTLTPLPAAGDTRAAGHDILIFAAEGAGLAELYEISRRPAGAGRPARLLPIVVTGDRVVMGPLSGATGPCWLCAQLRLSANGDPGAAADLWRELALGRAVDRRIPASGTVPAMIGNAAALEVFRLFSGQLSAAEERQVVVQDATTLESARETLLPHPECPLCRDTAPAPTGAGQAGTGPSTPHGSAPDHPGAPDQPEKPDRAEAPAHPEAPDHSVTPAHPGGPEQAGAGITDEELYERVTPLVSPLLGVLTGWADEPLDQIPMKAGRVRVAGASTRMGGDRLITAFHTDTILQARLAALRAALAWYAGTCPDRPDALAGTPADLAAAGHEVVADADLLTWTGISSGAAGANGTGTAPRTYLPAVSLAGGTPALVPRGAVYPFSAAGRDAVFERTPAGAAAGRPGQELLAAGLAGALAHRGLVAAIRGARPGWELPDTVLDGDEEARFARDGLARLGRRVRAYALPGAAPAYAVVAVLDERPGETHGEEPGHAGGGLGEAPGRPGEARGGGPLWTVGAALSAREALRAALRDALGQAQLVAAEGGPADLGDPLLPGFDPRTRWAGGRPGTWPLDEAAPDTAQAVAALARDGVDAYFVDTTTPDLRAVPAISTGTVLLAARPEDPG